MNDKLRKDELLPCPFCGSQPHLFDGSGYDAGFSVECPNCSIDMGDFEKETDVVEGWNTRKPDPLLAQLAEAVKAGHQAGSVFADLTSDGRIDCRSLAADLLLEAFQAFQDLSIPALAAYKARKP